MKNFIIGVVILLGLIVIYFIVQNQSNSINKNWYSKDDNGVNYVLLYAVEGCADKKLNSTDIVEVINYAYKGNSVSQEKNLKVGKCTKKVMSKYDPLVIWQAVVKEDTKKTEEFFAYIKEAKNSK